LGQTGFIQGKAQGSIYEGGRASLIDKEAKRRKEKVEDLWVKWKEVGSDFVTRNTPLFGISSDILNKLNFITSKTSTTFSSMHGA
jgi:hypothetical protein